jgi:cyclopropane-fatty-acyl-phospholipid synthase
MSAITTKPDPVVPAAARLVLDLLSGWRHGTLTLEAPDGIERLFRGAVQGPAVRKRMHDWSVCDDVLRAGDIGFAESYIDGRWDADDLPAVLALLNTNAAAIERAFYGSAPGIFWYRLKHLLRRNTRRGARRNIHAHYDLGNAFYGQWLDPTMTYSAALFEGDATRSLEGAQRAKYERVLATLDVQPGARILEIGCGWGGFAEYAAATRGAHVTGLTVSQAQLDYARARLARAGLAGQADLRLCDYRDAEGRYDHVVSIEMYEAVGERYWPAYFRAVHERLRPGGTAVIQAITIAESRFARYRRGSDFIQQYVFPGGMLASPVRFEAGAAAAQLATTGRLAFGLDYAATLACWRERFEAAWPAIAPLGFDERFRRLWRFYLAYCEAGFRTASTDVFQFALARGKN